MTQNIADSIKVERITLTPELARQMLENNKNNRPLKAGNVAKAERALRAGQWKFNGDAIRVDANGNMLDGQHRCHAIVNTGIAAETVLISGLDPEVFDTIDCGSPRSKADTLATKGEKFAKEIAAALMLIHSYHQTGDFLKRRETELGNSDMIALIARYPEVRQAPDYKLGRITQPSIARAMYFLFRRSHPIKAEQFFNELLTGVGLAADSPVYQLRQRLITNMGAKGKLSTRYVCALFIKAWNYYVIGRSCQFLRFREEGASPEAFPRIQ